MARVRQYRSVLCGQYPNRELSERTFQELESTKLRLKEVSDELEVKIEEQKISLKAKDDTIEKLMDQKVELQKKLSNATAEETGKLREELKQVRKEKELLEQELKKVKNENEELRTRFQDSNHLQETEKYDMMFRGKTHNPEDSARLFFDEGMYCEVWEEMEDWNDSDLGDLLVGTSKHTFASARDTIMWGMRVLMSDLFKYKEEVLRSPEERQRMQNISHAYGILLYYFKDVYWERSQEMFNDQIKRDKSYYKLYQRANNGHHKALFKKFRKEMMNEMKNMLTVSPPMIIHMPLEYKREMTEQMMLHISTKRPLLYTRPVIMNNYYGRVCLKGRAGNKDEIKNRK